MTKPGDVPSVKRCPDCGFAHGCHRGDCPQLPRNRDAVEYEMPMRGGSDYYSVINTTTGRVYGGENTFLLACAMRNKARSESGEKHHVKKEL